MRTLLVVVFVLACGGPICAQQGTGAKLASEERSSFSFDFSHRMRFVGWDEGMRQVNGFPVQFTHNRTRLGSTWRPLERLEVRAMLTNEFFNWIEYPVERKFNVDEVIFEHLYVKWSGDSGFPVDITLGRFDMPLGEGFVIMDGTPLDGSRTLYMNGARLDLKVNRDHNIALFYVHQPEHDDVLPIFNDRDKRLMEYVRDVAGVYYTGQYSTVGYDIYGMHSRGNKIAGPVSPVSERLGAFLDLTFGSRIVVPLGQEVTCTLEGAMQRGKVRVEPLPSFNRNAWAAHGNVTWNMRERTGLPATIRAGMYHYSSGQIDISEKNTDRYGSMEELGFWDPLLGRWPKWNESLVYSDGILMGPGYWSEVQAPFLEITVTPETEWIFRTSAHLLSMPGPAENGSTLAVGNLLTMHLFWKPDLPVSAHAMFERMWYDREFRAATPSYIWGRLEILYSIKW